MSLYSDSALTTLCSGSDVYLSANPTNKDADGLVNAVLNINKASGFNKIVYLKGTTNSGIVSDSFTLNVIVCG